MNSIEALKHALETLEEVQMAITTSSWMNRRIEELRAAIEQAEKQEGVCARCGGIVYDPVIQQRSWQGLTDEEYEAMAEKHVAFCYFDTLTYAKAIEAKLKGKNT